ncbi:MAG: T9SS type A sorting domain-containing protein [Bacteroidales bacterium]|jgi:hypothetical protein|nr:T9SS type A sorting domain-containing protein [Bacteroidales bacterium]
MIKKIISIFLLIIISSFIFAQIKENVGIFPISYFEKNNNIDNIIIPPPAKSLIFFDDEFDFYKIGTLISTNITVTNSGAYTQTKNKKKWNIKISCKNAVGLSLHFNYFNLQDNSEFFVYNSDYSQILGPFSKQDNISGMGYSIGIISGEEIYIEYNIPIENDFSENDFQISALAYIYRNEKNQNKELGFGSSENCNVNINCSEGNNFRNQQKGIARIYVVDGSSVGYCTGSLVNNTSNNGLPYFLTAQHCAKYASETDFQQWRFDFNYESSNCNSPSTEPSKISFSGCQKIAEASIEGGSDFLLVKITNISQTQIKNSHLVFNGWNLIENASNSGICINHPRGDIKKISTYNSTPVSATFQNPEVTAMTNAHWKLVWTQTSNGHGVTDIGSSGSPLFDNNGLIIGTLSGGNSTCLNTEAYDYFGKIFFHWNQNSNDSVSQLKYWLDPNNTNSNSCNFLLADNINFVDNINSDNFKIFPNPNNGFFKITLPDNEKYNLTIYDINGKLIKTENKITADFSIDMTKYNSGSYFMKLENIIKVYHTKILIIK